MIKNFKITRIALILILAFLCMFGNNHIVFASNIQYPTNVIVENVDKGIFKESMVQYPLNTSFEKNDLKNITTEQSGEISLTSDSYDGKFSLKIKPKSNELLLVKESEYFYAGSESYTLPHQRIYEKTQENEKLKIDVTDSHVCVSGYSAVNKLIAIMVQDKTGSIIHIDETESDNVGNYEFSFSLLKSGDYDVMVTSYSGSPLKLSITTSGVNNSFDSTNTELINTMTNTIELWIKPKYKAEVISFYALTHCDGIEKRIKILGDNNNDGNFRVGEDLSQGKWQKITLNLINIAEISDDGLIKDLYASANEGSEWVVDCITSKYIGQSTAEIDISAFAKGNIEYSSNSDLRFTLNSDASTEADVFDNTSINSVVCIDTDEKIIGINSQYGTYKKYVDKLSGNAATYSGHNQPITKITISGIFHPFYTADGNLIYYNNKNDNDHIYCYDVENNISKKVLESNYQVRGASNDGTKILTEKLNDYYFYDLKIGKEQILRPDTQYYLTPNGNLYMCNVTIDENKTKMNCKVYRLSGSTEYLIFSVETSYSSQSGAYPIFSKLNDDYFMLSLNNKYYVLKNNNNSCTLIQTIDKGDKPTYNIQLLPSGNKVYFSANGSKDNRCQEIDVNTLQTTNTYTGFLGCTDDNKLIFTNHLLNTITGEKEYFDYTLTNNCAYSSKYRRFITVDTSTETLSIIDLNTSGAQNKYLLSFDGKKTWLTYKNGTWQGASTGDTPSLEVMNKYGMSDIELNGIPEEAFNKIYSNGNEIYTLNIALGMRSNNPYVTPILSGLSIRTTANQPISSIYSSKIFTFDKSKYTKINGLFPVENFPKNTECYYLLYIGDDWLYTYKEGKLEKLLSSTTELFSDVEKNWFDIKLNSMDSNELRSIPEEVLTNLFVNKEFSNSEFGVIAVMQVYDDSTMKYAVDIKISAENNYLEESEYVLEIILNSGNKLVYLPSDITRTQIDDFLSWIDKRQGGDGNIFYRMKTNNNQNLINYYNITNINVYESSECGQVPNNS